MSFFYFALFVLVASVAAALFTGGDWQKTALGGLFGCLLGAMNYHTPLIDWLFPPGDEQKNRHE